MGVYMSYRTRRVLAVRREQGFIPVEVNASDTRNKADKSAKTGVNGKLANSIKELATNTALGRGADGRRKKVSTCVCQREVAVICSSIGAVGRVPHFLLQWRGGMSRCPMHACLGGAASACAR